MAKTKRGGSPCGLTPVLSDTVCLFQVNPQVDSFFAAAASANLIKIRLCWSNATKLKADICLKNIEKFEKQIWFK
jgi:hypothetical protein